MKNDMDEFEQRLSRRPLRQVPAGWRAEILAAAEAAAPVGVPRASFLATLNAKLSTLLWPCPQAWAGLTAIWIFIFALNFSMRDQNPAVAEKSPPPSPQMLAELKQQRRMLVELIGSDQTTDAEPPKFMPLPRSQRMEFLMT
jgi:hypothetical protein